MNPIVKRNGNYKYVTLNKVKTGEKEYRYWVFQRNGVRVYLKHPPGTADFLEEYLLLLKEGAPRTGPRMGSMRWLIDRYKTTHKWSRSAKNTKSNYERYFSMIIDEYGDKLASKLTPMKVDEIQNSMLATPGKADNYISVLSTLMAYAVRLGLRRDNPCDAIERISDGEYLPWPDAVIDAFFDKANDKLKLAFALLLYTGQRISDMTTMRWSDITDGVIHVTQKKTGKSLTIPIHRDLQMVLNNTRVEGEYILTSRFGRNYAPDTLRQGLRSIMKDVPDRYVFHGLRKNSVICLLQAGCNTWEVSSITGQSPQMVERYARRLDSFPLAVRAIQKWEESKKDSKMERKSNEADKVF